MKKGFTLIELLAVIVILAIIALIATPIVLNIINDSRVEGRKRSADALAHAMDIGYASTRLKRLSGNGVTIKDIIDATKINNELSRDNTSITTKDGIKCTIEGNETINFEIICIDTQSNNSEVSTKNIVVNPSRIIYTKSRESIKIGDSIVAGERSAWCALGDAYNSCTDDDIGYNTQQECVDSIGSITQASTCALGTIAQYGLDRYETDLSRISGDVYIKHEVVNNIITKSYICIKTPDICIRGGDSRYYGTYNGISTAQINSLKDLKPTGNLAILNKLSENYNCSFNSNDGTCKYRIDYNNQLVWSIGTSSDGHISGSYREDYGCVIFSEDGESYCMGPEAG